jgi:quinol monooxygenase YgiN
MKKVTMVRLVSLVFAILLLLLPNLFAQNRTLLATDPFVYEVSYIEVAPAARTMAITALKQYCESSRKEDGYVSCDLVEQTGRGSHFVVLEKWADEKRSDAHTMAESTKQLLSKLTPVRLGLDQQAYRTVTTTAAPRINDRAIVVVTHVDTAGNQVDAPALMRRLAEAGRKESGNLRFDVLQNAKRLNHFTIVEVWQTQEALEAHAVAAPTREYRDTIQPVLGSPLDERLFKLPK